MLRFISFIPHFILVQLNQLAIIGITNYKLLQFVCQIYVVNVLILSNYICMLNTLPQTIKNNASEENKPSDLISVAKRFFLYYSHWRSRWNCVAVHFYFIRNSWFQLTVKNQLIKEQTDNYRMSAGETNSISCRTSRNKLQSYFYEFVATLCGVLVMRFFFLSINWCMNYEQGTSLQYAFVNTV